MRRPLDRDLYADVVAEAKERFDVWPSAYASGWVVKTYKARGGRYGGGDRKTRAGLTKWFGESWVDLSRPIHDEAGELVGYEPCGRKTAQDASKDPAAYPKCRPLAEAMRMSPRQVKDAIKRKRAAEAKAARGGRGGRGARAPVRVATYRGNPDVTGTQAFRRWFGDSKVVDENGEPLVVYHGTNKSFDVFNTRSKSVNSTTFGDVETERSGIFVSDNPEFSREFGSRLLTLYVRIENPAEINRDTVLDFAETIDPFTERDLWLLARHVVRPWALFDGQLGPRFIAYLQELGHDGATFIEDVPKGDDAGEDEQEYVEGRTYVAFYPEQIKLADGTNTTFDPTNPDVRANPDTAFDWELPGTRGIREVTVDGVTVLYGYDGRSAHIASVRTKTKEQGQGKARRVLELFCAEADALGIPIRLEASPLTQKVNRARLVAFYESLGFEKTGRTINPAGDPEMVRLPHATTSRENPEVDTRALTGVPTFTPTVGEEPWELTLAELDRYQGSGPSSSLTRIAPPNQEPLPPIGTWRADPILRYVEQLQEIPIESLGFTEAVDDRTIRASVEAYIDYYLQGFEPLPASVVWNAPSQQLVTINRRRVLAAKLAGLSTVKAWVGGDKHEEVVERARAAGLATRANPLTDKGLIAIKAMRRAPEGSLLVSEDGGVAWRKTGPGRHNNGDWVRQKPSTTSPDGWKPTIGANERPMPPDDWEQIKRFVMREGVTVVPPRD